MQSRSNIAASRHFVLGNLHSYPVQLAYGLRPVRLRKHEPSTYPNRTFVSPSPPADRGLIVKHTKHAICAFVTCAAMVALAGCGDSKQVTEVKALPFADTNMTVDNALDTRKICDSVKWSVFQDDRKQTTVQYDCNYKGVDDSAFLQGESPKAVTAGDVWQWTYDASGTPTMTGVSMVVRHNDGSTNEVISGAGAGFVLSKMIVDNTLEDYDHVFSIITARPIPLKSQEPSSPIPDSTYGNKLAQFYQGLSSGDAAVFAYRQKKVNVQPVGTDALGYLDLNNEVANPADLYPVDPADVQLQFPLPQGDSEHPSERLQYTPRDLAENKLYCMGDYCFDHNNLVGRAPQEVLAKESGFVTDGMGKVTPVAQTQQATQQDANAQPASLGQALAQAQGMTAQPTAPASASTTDSDLPTGSQDWPTSTPCIKKLEDAYRKDRQAHGLDDTISMDQDNDFASTCKTVGQ